MRFLTFTVEHYLLLPLGAAVAIVWANTWGASYFEFANVLAFAVNDIGMAFVLAYIAQEVVEATLPGGSLHPWRRTLLPLVAAIGGTLGAVAVYAAYIASTDQQMLLQGWPIACPVDLAMCYLVARSIFRRDAAVTFLLSLAIVSDAIGLVIVSQRYPVIHTHVLAVALIVPAIGVAALLRGLRVPTSWAYVLCSGTLSWCACYWSGVHPALALLPIVPFLPHSARNLNVPEQQVRGVHAAGGHFEYVLRYPVHAVAFLFGLVNGGVLIRGFDTGTWALLASGVVGRPVGILIATALALTVGLQLPHRYGWKEMVVIALAAAPSFAFGVFFATAVFPVGPMLIETKMGAMATAAGAVMAIAAARVLRVGRFARVD